MDLRFSCDALAKIRASKFKLQSEVADAVGVSRSTYSRWETGETEPTATNLMRLAAVLRRKPIAFFEEGE